MEPKAKRQRGDTRCTRNDMVLFNENNNQLLGLPFDFWRTMARFLSLREQRLFQEVSRKTNEIVREVGLQDLKIMSNTMRLGKQLMQKRNICGAIHFFINTRSTKPSKSTKSKDVQGLFQLFTELVSSTTHRPTQLSIAIHPGLEEAGQKRKGFSQREKLSDEEWRILFGFLVLPTLEKIVFDIPNALLPTDANTHAEFYKAFAQCNAKCIRLTSSYSDLPE